MPFSLSPHDIRCGHLIARRNYYREYVIAPLERRLDCLKGFPPLQPPPGFPDYSPSQWVVEERQRVETEIAETQNIIGKIETEIRNMGKNADALDGIDMGENHC